MQSNIQVYSSLEKTLSSSDIIRVYDILRIAYRDTEEEVWGKDYVRIPFDEFKELLINPGLLVAYYNNKVAGVIHVYPIDSKNYGFGLLGADFALGGKGIGTALINTAEDYAINQGAEKMQIAILRVQHEDVPHKVRLAKYYKRLGYIYTHSEDSGQTFPPDKQEKLAAPSNFYQNLQKRQVHYYCSYEVFSEPSGYFLLFLRTI